jgi:hypothetical protein
MVAVGDRWRRVLGVLAVLLAGVLSGRPVAAGPPGEDDPARSSPRTPASRTGVTSSIAIAPSFTHELALPADPERMQLIWRPTSVAWPLLPLASATTSFSQLAARLDQREAMMAGRLAVPSVRGPVQLDEQRAVGVWIAALETIRVRQIGEPVPLRFIRGADGNAAVIESGREVAPGPGGERRFELHQPPSTGAVWSIEADAPTTVIVERVEQRSTRYVSVEVEYDMLEWIDAHGPSDAMPSVMRPDDDLVYRLRLHAALEQELRRIAAGDRKLAAAAEAWRKLAAINALDRTRPAVAPYFARDPKRMRPLPLDDTRATRLSADDTRDYRLAESPGRWTVRRKGPGQLRIAGRAWARAGTELQPAELRVYAGGRLLERLPLSDRQAVHSLDPDTALPLLAPLLTEAGDPVGEFAGVNVILAAGHHEYEIELIGGPALLEIEGTQRTEASRLSVRGWTPRKQARAAARALAKSDAPERVWLELLLARELLRPAPMRALEPADLARVDELAKRSPLLAVAALAELADDEQLDEKTFAVLVDHVRPWLASLARDTTVDPIVRGQLRTRWLMLAAVHGRGRTLDSLLERVRSGADPIAELPVSGLRILAELLVPTRATVRSPALAVLELARSRAPADEGLREQTLRLWTMASRWSRRRPLPVEPGVPLDPAGQWVVPREALPSDPEELSSTWLRLEVGQPVRVQAKLGADVVQRDLEGAQLVPDSRRLRLLDVYVSTPAQDRAPITLRVDQERWWSPMLVGVQRHRIAVSEGVHELELDGPAQTVAWAELPPADNEPREPSELGRRERMWPLSRSTWTLPGPAVPGVVRLELRALADRDAQPLRITMHEIGEHADGRTPPDRVIVFDPRTPSGDPNVRIDAEAIPIEHSAWAGHRHELTLPIHSATTAVTFEVVADDPDAAAGQANAEVDVAASLSLRRGLQPGDFDSIEHDPLALDDAPGLSVDAVFDGLTALDGPGMLAELHGLSRVLLLTEDDLERRARRAALLLMLGETGHARADLVRLVASGDHEQHIERRELAEALLTELERRFNALIEPREIVVADASRSAVPMLVEPALTAITTRMGPDLVFIEPWLDTWAKLRAEPLDAIASIDLELERLQAARDGTAPPDNIEDALLLGQLTRAQLLTNDPARARDAGRAWLELYGQLAGQPGSLREPLAVGLAAVDPLLWHLDDPSSDARDAGLAYGLARELEPGYGHSSVRRLAFIAALRSDWSTIDHSEDNSGFEHLELPVAELERTPESLVREALLVAPWPAAEAEELRPARKGVLAWDAQPGTVRAEFWCRAARPDLIAVTGQRADNPDVLGRARLSVRLRGDGRPPVDQRTSIEVRDGEISSVELPITRRARHRLEVVLDDDPLWSCSWRTKTSSSDSAEAGELVEARRRALWWTADSRNEVELVVLGPASVQLESRAVTNPDPNAQASALLASIERLDDQPSPTERGVLDLDGARERAVITESRRAFEVAHASGHTLLLTEAAPYRIRVKTDRGRALLRAQVRRDRGDIGPPAQFSIREIQHPEQFVADDFDWRNLGLASPVIARDEVPPVRNRFGSLDARVNIGLDDLRDVDTFTPRVGMFARVGWRRALVEDLLWLSVAAQVGVRAQTAPAFGGVIRLSSFVPVLGLRVVGDLDVLATSYLGQPELSVRASGFVDRPISLGRRFQLRPGLLAGLRWQSLDPAGAAAGGQLQAHPRVYNSFIENHPLLLQPELELRWFVFQDMAVWLESDLLPNSDLRGLDHIDVELGLDGIGRQPGPFVPVWGASYQASRRFMDEHRSQDELRHRLSVELGLGVWLRDVARIAFGAGYQLYMTPVLLPDPTWMRNVFDLWIRLDGAWGRRMRDYGPAELWFREPWAPRSFGDDDHQARSTQLRRGP